MANTFCSLEDPETVEARLHDLVPDAVRIHLMPTTEKQQKPFMDGSKVCSALTHSHGSHVPTKNSACEIRLSS